MTALELKKFLEKFTEEELAELNVLAMYNNYDSFPIQHLDCFECEGIEMDKEHKTLTLLY